MTTKKAVEWNNKRLEEIRARVGQIAEWKEPPVRSSEIEFRGVVVQKRFFFPHINAVVIS